MKYELVAVTALKKRQIRLSSLALAVIDRHQSDKPLTSESPRLTIDSTRVTPEAALYLRNLGNKNSSLVRKQIEIKIPRN